MKKSIFAFLTALLVVTGCMGCIGHIGNIRYRGDMENPGDVKTPEDMENLENMETSGDVKTLEDMETLENAGPFGGFPGLLTITARAAETAGTLLVVDDARLLSEKEKDRLINDYSAITEYMGAAFISTNYSPGSTASYAEQCAIQYYHNDPAVLFLIDMDDREIYVYANGTAQKMISKADARAITDNIYKSASRGDYYECADGAFRQIYAKCTGQRLARPVKHVTNALIALLAGVMINYFITVFSRVPKAERRTKGEIKASVSSQMAHMPGVALSVTFLNSVKHIKSSSSGGGGGGGGHSGGGGGHGF